MENKLTEPPRPPNSLRPHLPSQTHQKAKSISSNWLLLVVMTADAANVHLTPYGWAAAISVLLLHPTYYGNLSHENYFQKR